MYEFKIEGSRIRLAPFLAKNHEIKDAVSLNFEYTEEQEDKIGCFPEKFEKKKIKKEIAMDDSYLAQHVTFATGATTDTSEDEHTRASLSLL